MMALAPFSKYAVTTGGSQKNSARIPNRQGSLVIRKPAKRYAPSEPVPGLGRVSVLRTVRLAPRHRFLAELLLTPLVVLPLPATR